MKKLVCVLSALLLLSAVVMVAGCGEDKTTQTTTPETTPVEETTPSTAPSTRPFTQQIFENIKAAHYVSSSPENNQLLTTPPTAVTINFNFNLGTQNSIGVSRDGTSVTTGPLTVAPDKLSMSVPIDGNATGNYRVDYAASWPDGSSHNGMFGFSVQLP
ncbi:MAG: copper resistance protein CopC [Actinobacteria bacterium]|nr:copper resistance protein CopC [Actinomycetota bacterium]MBU1943195.1 copper resistance protein CopC [Actinomycetota bacterium]MBU2687873.1 copper resistance protein CopC [Actinomycetota bacterium]